MKKGIIIIFIIGVILISGCMNNSEQEIIQRLYIGEGNEWMVEYLMGAVIKESVEDGKSLQKADKVFVITLKYKGKSEDLADAEYITYSVGDTSSGKSIEEIFESSKNEPLIITMRGAQTGGDIDIIEGPEDIIDVRINVDGKIDSFKLELKD